MIDVIIKALKTPDIRKRLVFTLIVLAIFRLMSNIPVPGVDVTAIRLIFNSNAALGLLNVFSGGGLSNLSVGALGVGPYITASIIFQLLSMAIPSLKESFQDGMYGKQKLSQYTRFLTFPLALIQGYGIFAYISKQSVGGLSVFGDVGVFDVIVIVTAMVAGSFLLLWLGELISEYGIGNGVSIIIFAGILGGITSKAGTLTSLSSGMGNFPTELLLLLLISLFVIAGVVYVNEAFRRIDIQYSGQLQGGSRTYAATTSYIPVKINQAGVMPIIFAVSLVMIPGVIAGYLQNISNPIISSIGLWMAVNMSPATGYYNFLYFILVFGFTYFWTSIVLNPEEMADNIRKSGGFVKGIRPGKATATYLKYIITRLTLAGGLFLGLIAIIPSMIESLTGVSLAISSTGVLIVVSVVLETVKQIDAQVITHEYESVAK